MQNAQAHLGRSARRTSAGLRRVTRLAGIQPGPLRRACYHRRVGLTYVDGFVRAPGRRGRARRVRFLVDSGAVYSVLRRKEWKALGLTPERELDFVLADGTTLTREVSECVFDLEGRRATSPVVLGETEDEALLGAVTLETLGLMLNPLTRRLQAMRLILARLR